MYLVFTRSPGESYRRRLRSLLYSCYVSLVCWFPLLFMCLDLVSREFSHNQNTYCPITCLPGSLS